LNLAGQAGGDHKEQGLKAKDKRVGRRRTLDNEPRKIG
jgi:hypothetical protein